MEIYEKTLHFCSGIAKHGRIPENTEKDEYQKDAINTIVAAHESFRGIGYHKSKALFGEEIHNKFSELNKAYAYFQSRAKPNDWVEKEDEYLKLVILTIEELPELFKPYIYFGNYKA